MVDEILSEPDLEHLGSGATVTANANTTSDVQHVVHPPASDHISEPQESLSNPVPNSRRIRSSARTGRYNAFNAFRETGPGRPPMDEDEETNVTHTIDFAKRIKRQWCGKAKGERMLVRFHPEVFDRMVNTYVGIMSGKIYKKCGYPWVGALGADKKGLITKMIKIPAQGGCYHMSDVTTDAMADVACKLAKRGFSTRGLIRIGKFPTVISGARGSSLFDVLDIDQEFYIVSLGIDEMRIETRKLLDGTRRHHLIRHGWIIKER